MLIQSVQKDLIAVKINSGFRSSPVNPNLNPMVQAEHDDDCNRDDANYRGAKSGKLNVNGHGASDLLNWAN